MVNTNLIKPLLERFGKLSPDELTAVCDLIEVRNHTKRSRVTDIGTQENRIHWVAEGLLRKYFYLGKDEVVTEIAKEGDVICSFESLIKEKPSSVIIETIESTKLYSLSKKSIEWLCEHFPGLRKLYPTLIAEAIIRSDNRNIQRIMHEGKDMFRQFMDVNRDLVRRVPQKFLASYLNLRPETFSRYKHLLMHKETSKVLVE